LTTPTPPAGAGAPAEGARELWELTREEFAADQIRASAKSLEGRISDAELQKSLKKAEARIAKGNLGLESRPGVRSEWGGMVETGRRNVIEQALAAGKPVPAAVMQDYPDLAQKGGGEGKYNIKEGEPNAEET